MKKQIVVLAAVAALGAAAPAAASPQVTLTPDAPTAKWTPAPASGANTSWFVHSLVGGGTCANTDERSRCDSTLVFIDADKATAGKLTVRMDGFAAQDDFDLRVYDVGTKATGEGTYLGSPTGDVAAGSPAGTNDPRHTGPGDFESKEVTGLKVNRFYRVDVVYFAVANGKYTGTVTASGLSDNPPAPAQGQ